jgi:hypothetical protein
VGLPAGSSSCVAGVAPDRTGGGGAYVDHLGYGG